MNRATPLPKASLLRSPLSAMKTRSATASSAAAAAGGGGATSPSTLTASQARAADFLDRQLAIDEERHRQQQQQHKLQQQQQQQTGKFFFLLGARTLSSTFYVVLEHCVTFPCSMRWVLLDDDAPDLYGGIEDEDEVVEARAKAMQDMSAQRYFDVRRVKYPAHLALGDIDRTF